MPGFSTSRPLVMIAGNSPLAGKLELKTSNPAGTTSSPSSNELYLVVTLRASFFVFPDRV